MNSRDKKIEIDMKHKLENFFISFMQLKSDFIKKTYRVKDYFTEEDAEALRTYSFGRLVNVYAAMTKNISDGLGSTISGGIGYGVCPFCLLQNLNLGPHCCDNCPYAKNHGAVCDSDDSLWRKLRKKVDRNNKLTNEFYQSIQKLSQIKAGI